MRCYTLLVVEKDGLAAGKKNSERKLLSNILLRRIAARNREMSQKTCHRDVRVFYAVVVIAICSIVLRLNSAWA